MTAPINLILTAFEQRVTEALRFGITDTNRLRSLSDEARELPMRNIKQGALDPAAGSTFDTLFGVISLTVEIYDKGPDSKELLGRMNDHVADLHAAVMPSRALTLPFFYEVGWLGQSEPVTDAKGIDISAQVDAKFQVAFSFNREDPNVAA